MKSWPSGVPSVAVLPRRRSVEAAKLLEHQMYFWGRDVIHALGNLLVVRGATPFRPEAPAHKVRCYDLRSPQGRVVLHSTGVVLWPAAGGWNARRPCRQ